MDKAPAFQFYAKDYLSDHRVLRLSYAARGVYIQLLCLMWNSGKDSILESGIEKVLSLSISRWKKIRAELQVTGDEILTEKDGALWSKRLMSERVKQQEFSDNRHNAAKAGANARWAKDKAKQNGCDTHSNRNATAMRENASASATASATAKEERTIERSTGTEQGDTPDIQKAADVLGSINLGNGTKL